MAIEKVELEEGEETFFLCTCHAHAISVSYFDEEWREGKWREIFLSSWERAHRDRRSWRNKWHHIKRILKEGVPYLDEILLTAEDARDLGQLLLDLADT